jgi:hypothetical protein
VIVVVIVAEVVVVIVIVAEVVVVMVAGVMIGEIEHLQELVQIEVNK